MRKIVLKTAIITLGVTIILAVAVFGIVSLIAPAQMMRLTLSLGLDRTDADSPFQEYERSGDVDFLARSFEICPAGGYDDNTAEKRFDLLYTDNAEAFAQLCEERNDQTENALGYDYRDYVVGLGASVKYRLAADEAQQDEAIELAVSETGAEFPAGNPVIAPAVEAAGEGDASFCGRLSAEMKASFDLGADGFNTKIFMDIVNILEGIANE